MLIMKPEGGLSLYFTTIKLVIFPTKLNQLCQSAVFL